MNSVISFNQHKKWRDDIMSANERPRGRSCTGCLLWHSRLDDCHCGGTGATGHVTGLDFSEGMLEAGRPKVAEYPTITLVQGNAMELPFPDNSFDYVTIGFGLRNVPDYLTVLKEMNRVLKPGGMIACLETSQTELPGYRQLFRFYFKFIMPVTWKNICEKL